MTQTTFLAAEQMGWSSGRLETAFGWIERQAGAGRFPGAALGVGRREGMVAPRLFGHQTAEPGASPIRDDALFLVASITKPITVAAVLMLVERGLLALGDPVADFVPAFAQEGKKDVRVIHLMTHTSGLPDMLPNNDTLRAAHAPLEGFIAEIVRQPLGFAPGTQVRYQSMGTAMLAEIVHQVAGVTLGEFLRKEIFDPLGMADTALGLKPGTRERVASIRLAPERKATDWNWNSPYWLGFGAPWGGMITSAADLGRFCRIMLGGGTLEGVRLFSPATVRAMTRNQLEGLPSLPEEDRRCRPWGLGWRLNWPGHPSSFGDLLGPNAYGHWGATGTLCWLDPDADAFAILLTTEPHADDPTILVRASNVVAAATL